MRLSIRHKMVLGLAIIFAASYCIAIFVIGNSIQKNNNSIIEKNIKKHIYNMSLYLKQYIKSNGIPPEEEAFRENAINLGTILSAKFDERIIIYDINGVLVFDSIGKEKRYIKNELDDDLKLALKNKNAYTIINKDKSLMVTLSMPINIDDVQLGVIRYFFDYHYLISLSYNLFRYMHISILLIFVVVFVFLIYLSRYISKPIISMKEATNMITKGHFDYDVSINTNDELEDLAKNFNIMKYSIQEHIKELEIERDNLIRMHKHRKLFFDNVTHELKTPLTIISGYTQILQEYGIDNKEFVNKTLSNINNETIRMNNMILDLLNAAKAESNMEYNFEKYNLSKSLIDIKESMEVKARNKNIIINLIIEDDIVLYGDKIRIRQAITNIIDNSIKYSKEGAVINIKVIKCDNNCTIVIKDNGIGIEDIHMDNLFKPFYRVNDELRESNGLGLYIVKSIIERHGGSISLTSKIGIGTEVIIKIPLSLTI